MSNLVSTCLKLSAPGAPGAPGVHHLPKARLTAHPATQSGITLVELIFTVAIAAVIIAALSGIVNVALQSEGDVRERNDLTQQARFAMQRMFVSVRGTLRLMLPLADNPNTNWRENVREETVPASAPEGSSTKATAVLAVTLDPTIDRDDDGWADANNDKDFMDINNNGTFDAGEYERIDEDVDDDNTNDSAHGIIGIDDNGDGAFDGAGRFDVVDNETTWRDNDESSLIQPPTEADEEEDPVNGIDDDGDGAIDEDIPGDMNDDDWPGVAGIDDDHDGSTDEDGASGGGWDGDDDEDGEKDEDWFDPVVFYLNGSTLIERLPASTDTNGDLVVSGADYTESVIAENVTLFRVERIPQTDGRSVLVDLTLELTGDNGVVVSLNTRVRVGGGL